MINETMARRAKENYSFSSYKEGSATTEYNASVAAAAELIEKAKLKVSDEGKQRLDNLLSRYAARLADWTNRHNAAGASHVSWAIAGPSNYNMKKHNSWMNKEEKLMQEYGEITDIESKIRAIVAGDKIIKSDDANALDKLKEKLRKAQEEHEGYKKYNAEARKNKTAPLPDYVLANSNGRMKNIKDRIAKLERLAERAAEAPTIEIETESENGVKIIDNLEVQRVQIFFPDKPSAECRTELKKNGFRWAPSHNAWQSYRSYNATGKAQAIVNKYY